MNDEARGSRRRIHERLDRHTTEIAETRAKVEMLETWMEKIDGRLVSVGVRLDSSNRRLDWMIGIGMTVGLAAVGLLATILLRMSP